MRMCDVSERVKEYAEDLRLCSGTSCDMARVWDVMEDAALDDQISHEDYMVLAAVAYVVIRRIGGAK